MTNPHATSSEQYKPKDPSTGRDFIVLAEKALSQGDLNLVSDSDLRLVMTAAIQLYAAKNDGIVTPIPPVNFEQVSPTDVVVVASSLLRGAGLNVWDLSMWFQRSSID